MAQQVLTNYFKIRRRSTMVPQPVMALEGLDDRLLYLTEKTRDINIKLFIDLQCKLDCDILRDSFCCCCHEYFFPSHQLFVFFRIIVEVSTALKRSLRKHKKPSVSIHIMKSLFSILPKRL